MARFDLNKLDPRERKELLEKFFIAIISLESLDEVRNFFKDLFNVQEMTMFARRLQLAELLEKGKTYEEINKELGAGFDTISRVQRWLNAGHNGYRKAISNLKRIEKRKREKDIRRIRQMQPFTFAWFKKKYPTLTIEDVKDLIEAIDSYIRKRRRKKSLTKIR